MVYLHVFRRICAVWKTLIGERVIVCVGQPTQFNTQRASKSPIESMLCICSRVGNDCSFSRD